MGNKFKNLKVGDTVYVATTARCFYADDGDGKVVKVGRKYVSVHFDDGRTFEFYLANGEEKSTYPLHRLYLSKAAHDDELKAFALSKDLQNFLRQNEIPLASLIVAADAVGMHGKDYAS